MSGVAVKHVSEVLKRVLTTVKRELSFDIESEIAVDPIMAELFFIPDIKKTINSILTSEICSLLRDAC